MRVDLTGKTVMPAIINTHVHLGSTREQLIDQLQHYAFYGVGTVQSLGLDSAAVSFELRNETVAGAARYLTAGRGLTSPEPGRSEVPYWITAEEQARVAVQELAAQQIRFVKIWVDDRNGQYQKLSPPLYGAVIDEAHRHDQRVAAHIFALEDAKGLLRAGIDAFAHGIRDTDIDEEALSLFRERPDVVLIPNLPDRGVAADLGWLSGTVPPTQLQELQAGATDRPEVQQRFAVQARNLVRLNEAGVPIAMGTDGSAPWRWKTWPPQGCHRPRSSSPPHRPPLLSCDCPTWARSRPARSRISSSSTRIRWTTLLTLAGSMLCISMVCLSIARGWGRVRVGRPFPSPGTGTVP
jgi:cytosine/adenosine deaminase-related metal-dependent hydrolase